MRKALLIGIDDYAFAPLQGCVNDALKIQQILSRNFDLIRNFDCKLLLSKDQVVSEGKMKEYIVELFKYEVDVALLYYSGHGHLDESGGALVAQDASEYNVGISMDTLIKLANKAKAKEVVIVLDCCYSGSLGSFTPVDINRSGAIRKGISILTSSEENQPALEKAKQGLFTKMLSDALNGGAADILGKVTIGSVYNYVDKLLDSWGQRPIFKGYISRMISLRQCKPRVTMEILLKLTIYFPKEDSDYSLSPQYEYSIEPRYLEKEIIFGHLQKFVSLGLVEPVDEEHMYFAALNNKTCRLTPLGRYYWKLVGYGNI